MIKGDMADMMIKEIFGKVKIYRLLTRVDNRGSLEYVFDENTAIFKARETRIYSMPKEGTFFGIHYREECNPMTKFVTVIRGRGLDYIIDLREDSPTYLEWESIELSEENAFAVLIPAGFGHAFISLQNDTIQLYSVDRSGNDAHSKQINYKDSKIGLKLPILISEISDYDLNAPFISENDEENRMVFIGISKVFSTKDNRQYETIGAFWDELSKEYGRENLRGLGYNWTTDTIEYVIGLKSGDIDNANCSVVLPNSGWIAVKGKTAELDMIYQEIYADGVLTYEIETFTDEGECEILYYR